MKSILVFSLFTFFSINIQAQIEPAKSIYSSPSLQEEKSKLQKIAILPFQIKMTFRRMPKNMTIEMVREMEEQQRIDFQMALFSYLVRREKRFSVSFQDPKRTNTLLKNAEIYAQNDLYDFQQDSLCRLLGVDGVLFSDWRYTKTDSEVGALAKSFLLGTSGNVALNSLTLSLYGQKNPDLLWRFYKEMNEDVYEDVNETVDRMMRKVGRNFPFEKD